VRTGEEELFKARSCDQGSVKIIDIVRARLDTRSDSYAAEVPSLAIKDAQIDDELVRANERMLTDGFFAEVTLEYDSVLAQERNGRRFRIAGLRPIQMSNPNVLGILAKGRAAFTTEEWRDFLIRSIGLEPTALDQRAKMVVLLRKAPFVERNVDVDVEQQQRIGHLLSPLPREMRDDTAFQDRIHAYAPGWDFPKLNPNEHLISHIGLVSDFLSECWSRLRDGSRLAAMQNRIHLGGALSGRDIEGVNMTVSALIKLLFPDLELEIACRGLPSTAPRSAQSPLPGHPPRHCPTTPAAPPATSTSKAAGSAHQRS
jgi:predicted ATP-dependent Lon-type protease